MERTKNKIWLSYLIVFYYVIPFQPNEQIFFSHSHNDHTSRKLTITIKSSQKEHDFVLLNPFVDSFQQASNNVLTIYACMTDISKSIGFNKLDNDNFIFV